MKNKHGKLLVYAPNAESIGKRMHSVSVAAKKISKLLRLPMEVVAFGHKLSSIYVYYQNSSHEPIPIYCDKGRASEIQAIYKALRNMMFVLSFHPKLSALKPIRKEIMKFS